MREKLIRFMQGRYGVDKLSQWMMGLGIACWVLSLFTKKGIFSSIFLIIIGFRFNDILGNTEK